MKLFLKKILILIFSLATANTVGQDIHFSQFYFSPLQINPAKTGFITGDYRLAANYRNQWSSITTPYVTTIAGAELSFTSGKKKKDILGTGLLFFNDRAGDSKFNTTYIGIPFAINFSVDKYDKQYFGIGVLGAYCSSTISYEQLKWDEQFEGGLFTEEFPIGINDYYDLSVGAEYNRLFNKADNFTAGLAIYHLFKPNQTFDNDATTRVFRKLTINVGANFSMGKKFTAYPKMMYSRQGPFQELLFGYLQRYSLTSSHLNDYGIYFGALMRWNDAVIFATKVDLNKLSIGLSYDVNYSRLALASNRQGGPEIAILYTGQIPGMHKKKVFCPRF